MLLLDTQAVLWLVDGSPKLGAAARRLVSSATFVYVSAASVWELTIKSMLGKLGLPDDFDNLLDDQGLTGLPVTAAHANALRRFPELARHDPFDRLLLAQAAVEGLRLLTADRVLLTADPSLVVDATR